MMSLDMIMSTDLKTVSPIDSLAAVRTIMQENRIHHVPVVNKEDELVGLVTLSDVLAATDSILRDDESRLHATEIKVEDIMVRNLATIDENASLRQAALFLESHGMLEQIEESEPMDEAL
jgi:CBS domain-containing protein